ncbi:lysophospholipid acyltransferase family protein [Roseibium aestuarii]|uniref:Lysophospholipid acyltransferase family protein n=1 Tax=Roseibium aestuarii TaxID=2600299 RepID=A0ABW4JUY4_9HYPH|nr:lysophospholipid acyltransferase family protein [Roseibium aestuarii]
MTNRRDVPADGRRPGFEQIPIEETLPFEPAAPPLADLFAAEPARRHVARLHWLKHPVQGGLNLAFHAVLRHLPVTFVSAVGASLAPVSRRWHRNRVFAARIRSNLEALAAHGRRHGLALPEDAPDPLLDPDNGLHRRWWRNMGRSVAEFSVLNRLARPPHLTVSGAEHLEAAQATGRPLVFVSVHLGTWEAVIAATHTGPAGPTVGPFQPEPNRFTNRVIYRLRKARGQYLFPPGQKSAFRLHRLLTGRAANLIIFIDEVRDAQVHFPAFGRPTTPGGNALVAVKLANAAEALIVPVHCLRREGARLMLTLHPALPRPASGAYDPAATIATLNGIFEPLILRHLAQWYMLADLRYPKFRQGEAPERKQTASID